MSNPFWDYSLAVYQLDGVATSCLTLQDSFGLDVNLLLYAAWVACREQRLSDAHVGGVESVIVDWREQVVRPLRALRRQLQGYPRAAGVCDDIKHLELRAEQQQQDMMYAFFQQSAGLPHTPRSLRENLLLVAQMTCPETDEWLVVLERLVLQIRPAAGVAPGVVG
jgi:uncharacterized protein (TIGR02444 family)